MEFTDPSKIDPDAPIITNGPPPSNFNRDSILTAAEEQENRPTQFNAAERSAHVRDQITDILRLKNMGKSVDEVKELMAGFHEQYPTLFLKAMEPNFDKHQLNVMLLLLDRMGDGRLTQHKASVIVGQHLVDKYVKPMTKNMK